MVDALRAAVGVRGTLLMAVSADESEPFDALRSPVDVADIGVRAEVFRTYPGVALNDHRANRFAAIGPAAVRLLEPTPLHDCHGPGSVREHWTELGGRVLRRGADPDTLTPTDCAGYLADVPDRVRVRRRDVRADIGEVWIESLDDTDAIATWVHGDYCPQVFLDDRANGAVRSGPVGRCEAELFDAGHFVPFSVDWLNRHLGTGLARQAVAVRRARCRMTRSIGTRCAVPRPRGPQTQARRP